LQGRGGAKKEGNGKAAFTLLLIYETTTAMHTLLSVQILLLPHGREWVNVSFGTGSLGQSWTKGH